MNLLDRLFPPAQCEWWRGDEYVRSFQRSLQRSEHAQRTPTPMPWEHAPWDDDRRRAA